MQRTILIALATAVVAAGIATTATVLLTNDKEENAALVSPSPSASPVATTSVETASPSPDVSATPEATSGEATSSPAATATTAATTRPGVTIRSAKSVDCSKESKFCSSSDQMSVVDERKLDGLSEASDPKSSTRPTVSMDSTAWDKNKKSIGDGGAISSLHVAVVVSNESTSTFVFAKREIVLEIFKDGKLYDTFSTTGSGFEMTPGSKMNGTFERPITEDGNYKWRAKVWYYQK